MAPTKTAWLLVLLGIWCCLSTSVPVERTLNIPRNETMDPCYTENETFHAGERLTYKLYYNLGLIWLAAGEVEFRVDALDDRYAISVLGRTYKSYESVYKVHDEYYTEIDAESMLPQRFIRKVHEGNYQRYDSIIFDQQNHKALSFWGRTAADAKPFDFALGECMQDMLSIIYYVRNIDFRQAEKGARFPIKVFFDKEIYPLKVEYAGRKKRKKIKKLGRFNTLEIKPEVVAGHVFDEDTNMRVWISDDANRIPLLIESPVTVGSVKAVLKDHAGLKYPVESRVD